MRTNITSKRYGVSRKALFIIGLIGTSTALTTSYAQENGSDDRVSMMASVLSLYDKGEYAQAYDQVLTLERAAPGDASVQRWKARIESKLDVSGGFAERESVDRVNLTADTATPVPATSASSASSADSLLQQVASAQQGKVDDAYDALDRADAMSRNGQFADARNLLNATLAGLPVNTGTEAVVDEIEDSLRAVSVAEATRLLENGKATEARVILREFKADPSQDSRLNAKADRLLRASANPYAQDPDRVSGDFREKTDAIEEMLIKGRAQFVNGDYEGARRTFNQIESVDPSHLEAKAFLLEIAERYTEDGWIDRYKTREEMLNQVQRSWQQPRVFRGVEDGPTDVEGLNQTRQKLQGIQVPRVTFNGTTLKRAVQSLSDISAEFDNTGIGETPGVNMVVTSGGDQEQVSFSVRQVSLLRVLDIVAQQTGYTWDVVDGLVEFSPGGGKGPSRLERAFIPIAKSTLDLITDFQTGSAGDGAGGGDFFDPFAAGGGGAAPTGDDRQDALIDFFEASGIPFRSVEGASIVHRGSRLLVNHTARAIDEIRLTLRELDLTDQVEIEAKFMEVVQGDLDELGFQWNVGYNPRTVGTTSTAGYDQFPGGSGFQSLAPTSPTNFGAFQSAAYANYLSLFGLFSGAGGIVNDPAPNALIPPPPGFTLPPTGPATNPQTGNPFVFGGAPNTIVQETFVPAFDAFGRPVRGYNSGRDGNAYQVQGPGGRLSSQFGGRSSSSSSLIIDSPNGSRVVPVPSPDANFPGILDLGEDVGSLFSTIGSIGEYQVEFLINALQRKQGTDLLSAPKVTVISGKAASIVVAQELRYPESYSEPQLTASAEGGGGGSVIGSGGGSASVAVAAGVPEDFIVRNVGVELNVTPTVEPGDKINLSLNPRVTEFEGFVEYGAPSIAIANNTSVTSPSGYFQPIFSTRSVETEITVFDGATIVLGGLTREEVNSFEEKIPFLGDVPVVGRLFRSEGESVQKRNLMIFVTANLVSPGGSPSKQRVENVQPNALFQSPAYVSPGGILNRTDTTTDALTD